MTGRYCSGVSSDVCGMATTCGSSSAATTAASVATLSATRPFVVGSASLSRAGTEPRNSRRAAAANVQIAGESTGAVGSSSLPAKGLTRAVTRLETATLTASFGCFFVTAVVSGSATAACVTATAVVDADGSTAAVGASSASDSSVLVVDVLSASADALGVRDASVDRSACSATFVLGAFDSFQRLLDRGREAGEVSSSAASSFVDASESVVFSDVCPSSEASLVAAVSVDFASPDVSVDDPVDDDDSVDEDCDPEVSAGFADATP